MNDALQKYLPLVASLARRYRGGYAEEDDLFQVGCIGLLKALKKFDRTRNTAFTTYAVPVITGEIKMYLRGEGSIKYSRALKQQAGRIRKLHSELEQRLGRQPTITELAKAAGTEREEILPALEVSFPPVSLEGAAGERKETAVPAETDSIIDRVAVQEALSALPDREKKIMFYRYFRHKTQQEVADLLGLSQMQISRLERKVLQKLRKYLSDAPGRD